MKSSSRAALAEHLLATVKNSCRAALVTHLQPARAARVSGRRQLILYWAADSHRLCSFGLGAVLLSTRPLTSVEQGVTPRHATGCVYDLLLQKLPLSLQALREGLLDSVRGHDLGHALLDLLHQALLHLLAHHALLRVKAVPADQAGSEHCFLCHPASAAVSAGIWKAARAQQSALCVERLMQPEKRVSTSAARAHDSQHREA